MGIIEMQWGMTATCLVCGSKDTETVCERILCYDCTNPDKVNEDE